MVAFDSSFALIVWLPDVPCSVERGRERIELLLEDLEKRNEKILIPSPVLAEILVQAGASGSSFVNEILKTGRFRVAAFDTRAAIEVALQIANARKLGRKKGQSTDTWQKVKFDHQIVAICKIEEVSVLYSDDGGLTGFAELNGIKVISLADLETPPLPQPTLFDKLTEPEVAEQPKETSAPWKSSLDKDQSAG